MARVFLSLGSNVDPRQHIRIALDTLAKQFGDIQISPIYESEAVGFKGNNFINLVVAIDTELSLGELSASLRAVEHENGRDRSQPKFSARTLDIDILTYDDCVGNYEGIELPRDEILKNAFVLLPLSELAPQIAHPELKVCYADLWSKFDSSKQKLWRITL